MSSTARKLPRLSGVTDGTPSTKPVSRSTPRRTIWSGAAGRAARFYLERACGEREDLSSKIVAGRMVNGDVLVMETAGGGGWGPVPSPDVPADE